MFKSTYNILIYIAISEYLDFNHSSNLEAMIEARLLDMDKSAAGFKLMFLGEEKELELENQQSQH